MADALVTARAPTTTSVGSTAWPAGEVLRDIARGGVAGIVVGILVAGLGGRLVMRLATILHEGTVGFRTENGEVIGEITLGGTLALMTFGGLGMGLVAGTIWVIVSPWLPGSGLARALVTALAAMALGTPALIQRSNLDFAILDRDPLVIALLIGLVGLVGFSIALLDGFLDARLPRPTRRMTVALAAYLAITLMGLVLILPAVVLFMVDGPEYRAQVRVAWGLACVGLCTLAWWVLRMRGRPAPPRPLRLAGQASLLVTVLLGLVTSVPHILGAAGIRS
jgi:hypothetical protein